MYSRKIHFTTAEDAKAILLNVWHIQWVYKGDSGEMSMIYMQMCAFFMG